MDDVQFMRCLQGGVDIAALPHSSTSCQRVECRYVVVVCEVRHATGLSFAALVVGTAHGPFRGGPERTPSRSGAISYILGAGMFHPSRRMPSKQDRIAAVTFLYNLYTRGGRPVSG